MFRPVKRLCSSSPISGYAACDRRRRRVAPDTYAVEVEGIAKRFGKQPALDGVSLRIRRGEVYGLLGPNGAGKTTLIRSLVGLVAPEKGTVTVLGRRMPQLPVLAGVGYMTQQAALYPDISAEENVRFFGAIHGRENGVREALEFVDLWDRRKSVVSTLSGGMRTRCSLAGIVASTLKSSKTVSASSLAQADAEGKLRSGDIAGYVLLPSDFSAKAQQSRLIAPEIHLEGSQPGLSQSILQAVSQSFVGLAGQSGAIQFAARVTFLYGGPSFDTLDYFGAAFIGLVVFFLVFVITAVAFLRERGQGTLERLMASPLRRAEIVLGYMLGFTVLALVQSAEVLAFSLLVLHVHNVGNVALIFLLEALMAIAAVNLGIFLSMFARTEFQAVQFIPLVIVPQLLLAGIIFPVSTEPGPLQALSRVLPLTYAVEGLRNIMIKGADLSWSSLQLDLGVVLAFCVLVILAGATTLRRRIA